MANVLVADSVGETWIAAVGMISQSVWGYCRRYSWWRGNEDHGLFLRCRRGFFTLEGGLRTEIGQFGTGVHARLGHVRVCEEDVLRFEIAVDYLLPVRFALGGGFPPEGTVAEGVGDAVEDVPHESFGEDETVEHTMKCQLRVWGLVFEARRRKSWGGGGNNVLVFFIPSYYTGQISMIGDLVRDPEFRLLR